MARMPTDFGGLPDLMTCNSADYHVFSLNLHTVNLQGAEMSWPDHPPSTHFLLEKHVSYQQRVLSKEETTWGWGESSVNKCHLDLILRQLLHSGSQFPESATFFNLNHMKHVGMPYFLICFKGLSITQARTGLWNRPIYPLCKSRAIKNGPAIRIYQHVEGRLNPSEFIHAHSKLSQIHFTQELSTMHVHVGSTSLDMWEQF